MQHHYYSNRIYHSRPDSYAEGRNNHEASYRPRFAPRMASEPVQMHDAHRPNPPPAVYPIQGYQRSYDTVASGSNSGSNMTDQWAHSTDPSSENSSVDRVQAAQALPPPPPPKPDLAEVYGFNGFGEAPALQSPSYGDVVVSNGGRPSASSTPYEAHHAMTRPSMGVLADTPPPPVPPHHAPSQDRTPTARMPIKLGAPTNSGAAVDPSTARPGAGEKRKSSWFKRFSKG
ncbi:MAG: hypothetical protein M1823_001367 [Watsoniomyces obsoletus]|nr:MAG: hypothetical protein M1823_001367 [Watsoniomyces obsoletus]